MSKRPPFLSFEGPDGAGKSTQIAHAAHFLRQLGYEVECSREPGGSQLESPLVICTSSAAVHRQDAAVNQICSSASR